MTTANFSDVYSFAKWAFELGPFFFAILFVLIVPPYARRGWKQDLLLRQEGKGDRDVEEILVADREYFRQSWRLGFVLVAISVAWWISLRIYDVIKANRYVVAYEGFVHGVQDEDFLNPLNPGSVNLYLAQMYVTGIRQYRFVALLSEPAKTDVPIVVGYLNKRATDTVATAGGTNYLPLKLLLKPGERDYWFVTDPSKGARIVPNGEQGGER